MPRPHHPNAASIPKESAVTETISRAEIDRIKQEFILRNTLLDPIKVAVMLDCSVKKVYRLIESGDLIDGNDTPGKSGMRITAISVDRYRQAIVNRSAQHRQETPATPATPPP